MYAAPTEGKADSESFLRPGIAVEPTVILSRRPGIDYLTCNFQVIRGYDPPAALPHPRSRCSLFLYVNRIFVHDARNESSLDFTLELDLIKREMEFQMFHYVHRCI